MSINIDKSRLLAIDRIIEVMQAEYDESLLALKNDPALGVGDVRLPAPVKEAYYYQPYPIEDIPKNRYPCVFVFPSERRVLDSKSSSGPLGQTQWRSFQISVVLLFRPDGGARIERLDKQLTTDDMMWLRAELYTGAMARVIQEYACQSGAIHEIDLLDDLSEIVYVDQRKSYGVVQTTWRIRQNILMPRRRPLPDPQNNLQTTLQGGLG